MFARTAASYLLPHRRRLACGLVLGRRSHERYVETLAVIAIVFILVASAIEGYRYAIGKAAMLEAVSLVMGLRTNLAEEFAVTGRLPASTWVSDADGGRYFRTMDWRDGEIVLEVGDDLAATMGSEPASYDDRSPTLSFRVARTPDGEQQMFLCGFAEPPAGFTARDARHSTIPESFLPSFCRS